MSRSSACRTCAPPTPATSSAAGDRARGTLLDVSTIVFLHAHPDDESSQTAGMMFLAARAGHRVVEVIATDGALGTPPSAAPDAVPDEPGADIVAHRRGEAEASAAVLGIAEIHWLGYLDSGMLGWESNAAPGCLWQAPVAEAAGRLAQILDDVRADYLVGYDHHGLYGHPDHVRVHQISMAAVQATTRPVRLLFETVNVTADRELLSDPATLDAVRAQDPEMAAAFEQMDLEQFTIGSDGEPVGLPAEDIRWRIPLPPEAIAAKRQAMACHASQTSDIGFMLALPPAVFDARFGVEYLTDPSYLAARGTVGPPRTISGWPFAD